MSSLILACSCGQLISYSAGNATGSNCHMSLDYCQGSASLEGTIVCLRLFPLVGHCIQILCFAFPLGRYIDLLETKVKKFIVLEKNTSLESLHYYDHLDM